MSFVPSFFNLFPGKFGASACFSIVYLYTAELYTTELRGTAVGLVSTFGRIGGIIAPLLAGNGQSSATWPFIVMGGSALAGGLLAMLLPETLGTALPINMDDVRKHCKFFQLQILTVIVFRSKIC